MQWRTGGAVLSAPNRRRGRFGCPRVGATHTGFDSVAFVLLRNNYINLLTDLAHILLTPHRSWVPQPGSEGGGRGAPLSWCGAPTPERASPQIEATARLINGSLPRAEEPNKPASRTGLLPVHVHMSR